MGRSNLDAGKATRSLDVAQHEAAHAVVGVYLGLPLRAVRVRRSPDGTVGYTHFRCSINRRLHLGIMYAAGAAGDELMGRHDLHDGPWRFDFEEIGRLMFNNSELLVLCDMATRYLQGPCKKAWEAVTDELLHRDLSGPEIKALVCHGEALRFDK